LIDGKGSMHTFAKLTLSMKKTFLLEMFSEVEINPILL